MQKPEQSSVWPWEAPASLFPQCWTSAPRSHGHDLGVYGDFSPSKRSHIGLLCSSNLPNSFSPQGLSLYGPLCQAHPPSIYNTPKANSISSFWTLLKCHFLERDLPQPCLEWPPCFSQSHSTFPLNTICNYFLYCLFHLALILSPDCKLLEKQGIC